MALTIEQLNADTTFLLTLTPSFAPRKDARRSPAAYTILLDPWLTGHSSLFHPSFQISHHTGTSAIQTLRELGDHLDLIIISQDKPDHCHQATLCSLPPDTTAHIIATPAAARKIKSWRHFEPGVVQTMAPYDAEKPQTFLRIPLPSYTSSSAAGEITISHIPTKRDVAGLHNAIGITYRPPASILTSLEPDVPDRSDDFLSIRTPKVRKAKSFGRLRRKFSRGTLVGERPRTSQPDTPPPVPALISSDLSSLASSHQLPTPPLTPDDSNYDQVSLKSFSRPMTASSPWIGRKQERTLSVIYTPHGVSAAVLAPYIEHHLLPRRALPLTALFHGITQEQNPRLLGGIVANGAPGGVEIARMTKPRYWISAHDELKENKGLATVWIKSRIFEKEEVEALLTNAGVQETKVWVGEVGERLWV
nr:uncharacterized protein LOC112010694 [Quercus suber]